MSNNNLQIDLQEAQQKKINYFCEFINNNNISQAEYYLNKANWDENLAIEYFYNRHDYVEQFNKHNKNNINLIPEDNKIKRNASAKSGNKINNNNIIKKNYIKEVYNQENKYIEFNIDNLKKENENKGIHATHDKTLLYIKNNLKNVETNFKIFIQKLINKAGIILIFREDNIYKIKEQINQINEIKEKIQNYIIFPTSINTYEGTGIILGLSCISFPCYIFCKYKDENNLYITDRMEGAFEKKFVFESIFKIVSSLNIINNENNKKQNMKNLPRPQINTEKREKEQIFKDVFNEFRHNELRKNIKFDKIQNQKPKGKMIPIQNNNHNKKDYRNEIKRNEINHNDNKKNEKKQPNFVDNNNTNNNKNDNVLDKIINIPKEEKNKKEEFKDLNLGDFFLGDSIEIPNLFGIYNKNSNNSSKKEENKEESNINNNLINKNNQNILDSYNNNNNQNISKANDMMLRDSIYNLSDGQVLAKREQEIRRLEKIQEEKEKKEKEEKMKQLEEEKKIKKYEKEAEIARMILAPEPDGNNPNACHIKFRLPDGEKMIERRFLKSDKISVLYNYVKSIGREIFVEPDTFDFNIIVMGFPPKNLDNLKDNTLEKEGLYPNSILQIEEK